MIFLNICNAEALESPCAALSAGSIARCRGAVECRLADGGRGGKRYSFVVQTYSGSRVDLYRSLYLPTEGVVAQAAEAVASLCGRTCAFSRHSFW